MKNLFNLEELNERLKGLSATDIVEHFANKKFNIAFSTSFGVEDQALTHILNKSSTSVSFFTLDTGRLHEETYKTMSATAQKYASNPIKTYYPSTEAVEKMVSEHGINLFYNSRENRALCCQVRKVEPLKRALNGVDIWITGRRTEQSTERSHMPIFEFDEGFGVYKLNPLADWSLQKVWDFIKENKIPYNPLHNNGYPSIGCAPCTRAVDEGEDFRKGRWWWEDDSHKECGLHIKR